MTAMSKITIVAKLTVQEGSNDAFTTAFSDMLSGVEANEPGVEMYVLSWDKKHENVAWITELYSDADALETHGSTDHMKAFGEAIGGLLAGRPEISRATPVAGVGIEL
jgi:quinol monooxygenase YgiN